MSGPMVSIVVFVGVLLFYLSLKFFNSGVYQRWKERRADQKAIKEALAFMEKWKVYDIKKADEMPLPPESPFAMKLNEYRRKIGYDATMDVATTAADQPVHQPDPYVFDKMVREMVGSRTTRLATDEEVIGASADKMKDIWRTPNERWDQK